MFNALQTYLGSTYVNQITKFGRTLDVYAQADTPCRLAPEAIKQYTVRTPAATWSRGVVRLDRNDARSGCNLALQSLSFRCRDRFGAVRIQLRRGAQRYGEDRPAHSSAGNEVPMDRSLLSGKTDRCGYDSCFALAMLIVYFVLAGQYESWILPLAVIFAIPLAVLGTVLSLRLTGLPNNLYVQIGLVLLIALSAKNAILVVEMARQRREAGCSILTAAVEGARLRFRPILMTSFTFILGVAPLILATGAGAASRQSLGISVASGMLASTCLAVVFVPSFFVVLQRLQERRRGRVAFAPLSPACE